MGHANKGRAFVGLSGGVDSALAAALLAEDGWDVTCVYMRNWTRDLPGFRCPWADELAEAERVAVSLGVPLEVWDYEQEYQATVLDYLVSEYAHGRTPNPDVICNQTIKFGSFATRALAAGADLIATGHYAQVEHGEADAPAKLLRAADAHKDQTYFLWRVPGEVLNHAAFPIGHIASKAEVREMCRERGLENADRPDSDGICFIGPVGLRTFLLDTLERRPGDVVEWGTGRVLGRHEGAFLYTVGQRRGLNLGGGPARYVVSVDVETNVVTVTDDLDCPGLWTGAMELEDCRWIAGEPPAAQSVEVRCRHTGTLMPARLEPGEQGRARVIFPEPVRTVAPGQSCVAYAGDVVLGGGIICKNEDGSVPSVPSKEHV